MRHKHKRVEPSATPRRKPSTRAKLERTLGHKLLTGEIPVVPPNQLHRCPVPSTHAEHDELCKEYNEGKLSYDDALAKVGDALKKPEPKPEEPKPEGGS